MQASMKRIVFWLIAFLMVASFTLGFMGWIQYYALHGLELALSGGIFLSLQLFTMNTSFEQTPLPLALDVARFLAPFSLATALLNAFFLLLNRFVVWLQIRLFFQRHFIFNGLNFYSSTLIRDLLNQSKNARVVVLEKDEENIARYAISNKRVKTLAGNPSDIKALRSAGLNKAHYVMGFSEHDDQNLAFIEKVKAVYQGKNTIQAHIMLNDPQNFNLLMDFQTRPRKDEKLDIHVFNFYRKCAAYVVDDFAPDTFTPVLPGQQEQVCVALLGLNPVSEHLLIEAVQMYHFANLQKTRFMLLDQDIQNKYHELLLRYPGIEAAADVECIELTDVFREQIRLDFSKVSLVFVCAAGDAETAHWALKTRQLAYHQTQQLTSPPMVAVLRERNVVDTVINPIKEVFSELHVIIAEYANYFNAYHFVENKMRVDAIAKYLNAFYMIENGVEPGSEQIEKAWDAMTDREKEANRLPARHYNYKLRLINAQLVYHSQDTQFGGSDAVEPVIDKETLELMARMEKNRWNAEKRIKGFIPGQNWKDLGDGITGQQIEASEKRMNQLLKQKLKYHPMLVEWEEIDESVRQLDRTGILYLHEILSRACFTLRRFEPRIGKTSAT